MPVSMGRNPRPPKALGNQRYQDEVADGKTDIIDSELDDDIGTLYDMCNGNLDDTNINSNLSGVKIAYEKLLLTGKIQVGDLKPGFSLPGGSIAPGSVDTAQLKDGSVTTAKLHDGAVTTAKIAPGNSLNGPPSSIASNAISATALPFGETDVAALPPKANARSYLFLMAGVTGQITGNAAASWYVTLRLLDSSGQVASATQRIDLVGGGGTSQWSLWAFGNSLHVGPYRMTLQCVTGSGVANFMADSGTLVLIEPA